MFRRLQRKMQLHLMNRPSFVDILFSLNEIYIKLQNNESVDWKFVRLHLGMTPFQIRYTYSFCDLCISLLRLMVRYQCRDLSIIIDTIQIYCFEYERSKRSLQKAKAMRDILINNKTCCRKDAYSFVARLMIMPYKSFAIFSYDPLYDVIQKHIRSGNRDGLKLLLYLGVMYLRLSDNKSTWTHCFETISSLLSMSEKQYLVGPDDFLMNIRRLSFDLRNRMLAVFRGVEVILKARELPMNARDYALCFRMAWETIPEPVITSKEIVAFMSYAVSGPVSDRLIDVIRKDYEKLFPESTEPLNPKSLKYLSRCQIRQNFRKAGTFPYGVQDLHYPPALKDYILIIETQDMREKFATYIESVSYNYNY